MTAPVLMAPVASPQEALSALEAGAGGIYCGVMPDDWVAAYGDLDLLTRRQGRTSHLRDAGEMAEVAGLARQFCKEAVLVLNGRYSDAQTDRVLELARLWDGFGGTGVMLADPGLLMALAEQPLSLAFHLSLLAGTFNSTTARFFAGLGVSRIVLPRDLTLHEIRDLTTDYPDIEYEILTMYQKCTFIDGFCGFYHGVSYPSDLPALFDYGPSVDETPPSVGSLDPSYEGHGCTIPWKTGQGLVRWPVVDDARGPSCAACELGAFYAMGLRHFKIAGRGFPPGEIVKAIAFLNQALNIGAALPDTETARNAIREQYARIFGVSCRAQNCYFQNLPEPGVGE
jgi:collagenase-like PrtC family protease